MKNEHIVPGIRLDKLGPQRLPEWYFDGGILREPGKNIGAFWPLEWKIVINSIKENGKQ